MQNTDKGQDMSFARQSQNRWAQKQAIACMQADQSTGLLHHALPGNHRLQQLTSQIPDEMVVIPSYHLGTTTH
ncbi:hypothetical protein L6164_011417 [Bauhinia variegata]|uniref:Uncharacterized protein n=1 Tax=Bauhinia variegata TaxID=167791 RepID=A0ACB9P663_BAUVA|nr:hypothetical protein L6164_011417 [Bauhinia variegata]